MKSLEEIFGPNTALVEELYNQYKDSPESVPDHWKSYFNELESKAADGNLDFETAVIEPPKTNGHAETLTPEAPAAPQKPKPSPPKKEKKPEPETEYERLKGVATKVVENMEESLELPTATSLRTIPVKMLIEDRLLINEYLEKRGDSKITFTHLISWAIIHALREFPNINNHFEIKDDKPYKVK
ncbi:MAG TPA: 2-oxo acid dehydrogenase subunit E2, partial [Balneolales bacterium]|nr:2-oxo acid dehydrogenase subunit E2 [Balneolales bacterium]